MIETGSLHWQGTRCISYDIPAETRADSRSQWFRKAMQNNRGLLPLLKAFCLDEQLPLRFT